MFKSDEQLHWCMEHTYVPLKDAQKLQKDSAALSHFQKIQVMILTKFEKMKTEILEKSMKKMEKEQDIRIIEQMQNNLQKELKILRHHVMQVERDKFYEIFNSSTICGSQSVEEALDAFKSFQQKDSERICFDFGIENTKNINNSENKDIVVSTEHDMILEHFYSNNEPTNIQHENKNK